ncbi:MAG: HD domain-containing protein [Planctomycetota bacterium]
MDHRNITIDHPDPEHRIAEAIDLLLESDWEPQHALQVRKLALAIFDQLAALHGMDTRGRLILEAASLLHDVGFPISQRRHHKISFDIIRGKLGKTWPRDEAVLVALVARYHRKAEPSVEHAGFADLDERERSQVASLSAILRVADGLDRTHSAAVRNLELAIDPRRVLFRLSGPASPTDEWGARRKADLFEETFGRKVAFEWVSASTG